MAEIFTKRVEVHVYKKTKAGIRYLVMKRADKGRYPNLWQMVSGTMDEGEKAYDTAIREMKEEIGLEPEELHVLPVMTTFYNSVEDSISILPVFLAKVSGDVVLSDEHSEYKWVDFHKAYKLLSWVQWKENVFQAEKVLKNKLLFNALQKIEI